MIIYISENYTAWLYEVVVTTVMEQQTVTNPAVMHGLCAITQHYVSNVLLAQARLTTMISSCFIIAELSEAERGLVIVT